MRRRQLRCEEEEEGSYKLLLAKKADHLHVLILLCLLIVVVRSQYCTKQWHSTLRPCLSMQQLVQEVYKTLLSSTFQANVVPDRRSMRLSIEQGICRLSHVM